MFQSYRKLGSRKAETKTPNSIFLIALLNSKSIEISTMFHGFKNEVTAREKECTRLIQYLESEKTVKIDFAGKICLRNRFFVNVDRLFFCTYLKLAPDKKHTTLQTIFTVVLNMTKAKYGTHNTKDGTTLQPNLPSRRSNNSSRCCDKSN